MNYKFKLLKQKINKELNAIDEDFDLSDFINYDKKDINLEKFPFEYVVLDNFFKDYFYKDICNFFNRVYERGFSKENDNEKLHPFLDVAYPYDGYVKSIHPFEDKVCEIIYSNQFNLFLSKIFNRPTSTIITPAFHFHEPHDKTGWVHNDYAEKNFFSKNILYNGVIPHSRYESSQISDIKEKRAIALIYYFGNDLGVDDGGGTGLYESLKSEYPYKVIAPKNNRLLLFSVSPKSYHAFQQNKKNRCSIVLWLHTDTDWTREAFDKDRIINKKENENTDK